MRYGDSLPYGHGIEKWQICLNLCKDLNYKTREFVDDVHFNALLNQTPMLCLNFFLWFAKDTFKKEYPGFFSLEVPLAYRPYPFDHDVDCDTPIRDEME